MKKKALVFLTIVSMVVSQAAFAFAGETSGKTDSTGESTVPDGMVQVKDNFSPHEGLDDGRPIEVFITTHPVDDDSSAILDFYISNEILMGAQSGEQELEVTDLTVINNNKTGKIKVSKINIQGSDGWGLVDKNNLGTYNETDNTYQYFSDRESDTKEFYLVVKKTEDEDCSGTYDKAKKSCEYTEVFKQTDNDTPIVISFRGYTGLVTKQIDKEKAAEVVVTVSIVEKETEEKAAS